MRRPTAHTLARLLSPKSLYQRAHQAHYQDAGHGFDAFGLNPDWVALVLGAMEPIYKRYFRVTSYGAEHIPATGAAILAANHSGSLPFDGMMLWADVLHQTEPPRVPRVVMDHFVGLLPFVGALFARAGGVGGSRGNMHALLDAGELVGVFPEGVPGVGKRFSERYQLQAWRAGHVEMAIRHQVPVVPVAFVGPEEQMPQLARLPIRAFGAPYLPITATPLPLPVHYHVHYGRPIDFGRYAPAQADDPQIVRAGAEEVKAAVQSLIDAGLAARKGVFA